MVARVVFNKVVGIRIHEQAGSRAAGWCATRWRSRGRGSNAATLMPARQCSSRADTKTDNAVPLLPATTFSSRAPVECHDAGGEHRAGGGVAARNAVSSAPKGVNACEGMHKSERHANAYRLTLARFIKGRLSEAVYVVVDR